MPVSDLHPSYSGRVVDWSKCRDAYEGSDTIKARGITYLPRLSGQSEDDYLAYKTRALFYGITAKSVSALVGMATAKAPQLQYPAEMKSYFEDHSGLQFHEMWGTSLTDTLLIGRIGALIDAPSTGGNPYISTYPCENIINWEVDEYDNFTMVVLYECFYVKDPVDEFKRDEKCQYRVLRLKDGVYTQQVYDDNELPGVEFTPTFAGKSLKYIPFFVVNPFGLSSAIVKPPMMDIVTINLSHYLSSADLEHGRHFTGLPTPVAIGVETSTQLYIGSQTAWIIPDPGGDAKYLEFTGQGLQSLEKALTEKQSQLAAMSARFLDQSNRGSEDGDVVRLRFMSETSSLSLNVTATEAFFNMIYKTVADMMGLGKDSVKIEMNKDFTSGRLSGTDVLNLVKSWMEGGMSNETLAFNLKRGEMLPIDRTIEEEVKSLEEMKKSQDEKDNKAVK